MSQSASRSFQLSDRSADGQPIQHNEQNTVKVILYFQFSRKSKRDRVTAAVNISLYMIQGARQSSSHVGEIAKAETPFGVKVPPTPCQMQRLKKNNISKCRCLHSIGAAS